jgi:tetratricopeptide (TPR) repeat protein
VLNSLSDYLVVGLTLLATALGGSTELWAQGFLALATGILLVVSPPTRSLGRRWHVVFIGLALLALAAYLPAGWFGLPGWRRSLLEIHNDQLLLPVTRTPQPWVTFEASGQFGLGLVWAYYLIVRVWAQHERSAALRIFCMGILLLAIVTIMTFALGWKFPLWHQEVNRGWFPNRNQTANVLALSGIMIYALGFSEIRTKRNTALLWFAGMIIICGALIVAFSRAGVIIFFIGTLAWHVWSLFLSRSSMRAYVGVASVLLLLSVFFLMGGETFERFQLDPSDQKYPFKDFRVLIQRDALPFAATAPGLGIGLGNFGALFTPARQRSINQATAIHPESDWLWVSTELGWISALLLVAGIVLWLRECFPLEQRTDRFLRSAAVLCGVMFALHGLIDVPGHRIGTVWPVLFLASLAISPKVIFPIRPWVAPTFRALGALLAALGLWWLASCYGKATLPTSCELDRLEDEISAARDGRDYKKLIGLCNRALRIAPLAWNIYFERASAEALTPQSRDQAFKDFQVARFLQPHLADLYFKEGAIWMSVDEPALALDAWMRALRSAPDKAHYYFYQMVDLCRGRSAVQSALREIARDNIDCLLVSLGYASPSEFDIEISRLLSEDPGLKKMSKTHQQALFAAWFQRGDRKALLAALRENPDWMQVGWRWLAESYAVGQNFQQAYETVRNFEQPPTLPQIDSKLPLAQLQKEFQYSQYDLAKGIELYMAQLKKGQTDEALTTVRKLTSFKEHPRYLSYVEAELWAKKENWQKAWEAWQQYSPP